MEAFFRIPRALVASRAWQSASPAVRSVIVTVYQLGGYRSNEWEWHSQKFSTEPGQFITSLPSLAKQSGSGVTEKHARMALRLLETGDFIRSNSSTKGRLITVLFDEKRGQTSGQTEGRQRADPRADQESPETPSPTTSPAVLEPQRADPRAKTGQTEGRQRAAIEEKRKRKSISDDRFESFWSVYPKRVEKSSAYRCWLTRIQEGHSPEQMIRAAEEYAKECEDRDPKYIKHPKTFLGPDKPFLDRIQEPNREVMEAGSATEVPENTEPMTELTLFMREVME